MSGLHIPPFGERGPYEGGGGSRTGVSPSDASAGGGVTGRGITEPASRHREGTGGGGGGGGGRTTAVNIGGRSRARASADEGKPVSRQLSRSYFVPRSLEGYERHLRQIHCEGYLQRQSRTSGTWRRRWFLLKDGYLSYFQDQEEAEVYRSKDGDSEFHHHPSSQRQLSLDCVEAVRTEEKIGPLVFRVISSHRDDLVLRAESKEGMNDWLFGFHRALASIIARVIENKHGVGSGGVETGRRDSGGAGDESGDGGGGGGDPFRVGGDTEIRKVLGHGHGRSRRLSLRHYRMGSYGAPGCGVQGSGAGVGVGTYGGHASARHGASQRQHNGHSAPDIKNGAATTGGVGFGASPGAASAFGGDEDNEDASGGDPGFSPAFGGGVSQQMGTGGQILLELAGDGGGGRGGGGRHYRVASFGDDECRWKRRTESLGCYQRAVDPSSPYGLGYHSREGPHGGGGGGGGGGDGVPGNGAMARAKIDEAQGSEVIGAGVGRGMGVGGGPGISLSRARSAGFEPNEGEGDFDLIDEFDFACQDRLPQTSRSLAASVEPADHQGYASSGDEGRSSESGHGSTSDEGMMVEAGLTLTSQEAMGLGLGMNVEPHSLLAAAAVSQEESTKHIPPAARGKFGGGGGGGKYIPPAMRAAAAAVAAAAAAGGASSGSSPRPSQTDPEDGAFDLGSMDMDLGFGLPSASGATPTPTPSPQQPSLSLALSSQHPFPGDGSCPASPPAVPYLDPSPPSAFGPGGGGGGGGLGSTRAAWLYPWAPANKEHYFTGDFHARRPCDPESRCNVKGGGCGGGPVPTGSPVAACSGYDEPIQYQEQGHRQPAAPAGAAAGIGGEPEGMDVRHEGIRQEEAGVGRLPRGGGGEGLWWTCGAWSIMGRREKQEDRFCVMPDYTKSVAHLFLDETSSAGCCTSGGGGNGGGTGGGGSSVGGFSAGGFDECSSSAAVAADRDSVAGFGVGGGGGGDGDGDGDSPGTDVGGLSPSATTAPAEPLRPATATAAAGAAGPEQDSLAPCSSSSPTPSWLRSSPAGAGDGRLAVDLATSAAAAGEGAGPGLDGVGGEVGLAQGYFGVYDGHCGSEAVQFVRDQLHAMVGEHPLFWKEPERAMRETFLSLDEKFLALAGEREWYSGTTVLVALMRGRKLLIGNLGDCEAVLCRGDDVVHMSPVHSPARPCENERILAANGWVTTERELFLRQLKQMDLDDPQIRMAATEHVRWTTITRVCGELAVSRSIGDRDFKGFTKRRLEQGTEGAPPLDMPVLFAWPHGHTGEFYDDLLTAEPEFEETVIGLDDEFLLMACDGLWDVLGKREAVDHAKNFFDEGMCSQAVAEHMCELAYRMGTSDNVTVVIVQFHHFRPF
eukprot:g12976.t1